MLVEARANWPVLTGASRSTLRIEDVEVGDRRARIALGVGGPPLIEHPDNPSHRDYAPIIELIGSPLGRGKDTIRDAVYGNEDRLKQIVRERLGQEIDKATR